MFAKDTQVGIYGGSFDPFTNSHKQIILESLEYFDKVYVVPCGRQENKIPVASPMERLIMTGLLAVEIAQDIKQQGRVFAWPGEVEKIGVSLAITTIREVEAVTQNIGVWIGGADLVEGIEQWHDYQQILERGMLIHPRIGVENVRLRPGMVEMKGEARNSGSHGIRADIAAGRSVKGKVPPVIYDYIAQNHLYR